MCLCVLYGDEYNYNVDSMIDSDVYVIVIYVIVIYVIIVVYVDNSVWMVLMCNVCLLIVYCICV